MQMTCNTSLDLLLSRVCNDSSGACTYTVHACKVALALIIAAAVHCVMFHIVHNHNLHVCFKASLLVSVALQSADS